MRTILLLNNIDYANHGGQISLIGGFLENLFPFWWEEYPSVADYLDFYLDGFTTDEIAAMGLEYGSLEVDEASDDEINSFLRRMNANYSSDQGSSGGRDVLVQIGDRLTELEHGAVLKQFD